MFFYLFWHYTGGVKSFLKIWRNYIRFFWHYFSIPLLFKTLFYHWHRDISVRGPGFDIREFFQILVFNLLSRIIGAIARLVVIITGLFLEAFVAVAGGFLFVLWLIFPSVVIGLFLGGFVMLIQGDISGLTMILGALVLAAAFYVLYSIAHKRLPSQMHIEDMMDKPWFDLVWTRIGIEPRLGRKIPREQIIRTLEERGLNNEDFNEIVKWVARDKEEKERKKMFWSEENLFRKRGIGKNWAYGFTNHLDKFSVEISGPEKEERGKRLIGRAKELEAVERILSRSDDNNVLVIGDPGTGRATMMEKFAEMVYEGSVLAPLQHKRVLELDMAAVMSGAPSSSEMENRLRVVLNEAAMAGNVILVLNDFQNFTGGTSGLGKTDVSGILIPYLNSRYLQLIAVATRTGFHANIENNIGLMKFFEKVEMNEPDEKTIQLILQEAALLLEDKIGITVTYSALEEIIKKSVQYRADMPMPEGAIDLLEESMIFAKTKTNDFLLEKGHVDAMFYEKTGLPAGELPQEEKILLANLEEVLHKRIIGQDEAIKQISSAMRRARTGVGQKNRPVGSFLFLGPTGVGKTETAKALAQAFFSRTPVSGGTGQDATGGNMKDEKMVRLDMSEYQNLADISRLIGLSGGDPGFLPTQMRENPFSLVLLDEIEKAHPNILNVFLQVLDEGFFTDGWNRKVNFRNSIIIATSNAAAELIRQMVEQNIDPNSEKEKVMDFLQKNNIFKPEFLNRFDGIVVFHPLTKRELLKVAKLMLDALNVRLAEKKITLGITPELLERVVDLGYNPEYGARPMRRAIQDKIEDLISKKILDGTLSQGGIVEIKPGEI